MARELPVDKTLRYAELIEACEANQTGLHDKFLFRGYWEGKISIRMSPALLARKQSNQTILTQLFPVLGPPPAAPPPPPPAAGASQGQPPPNPPPIYDRFGRGRDLDDDRDRNAERRDLRKIRLFQEQFEITSDSCYPNKIQAILNKAEVEVLGNQIQDLLKKYLQLQEDIEDTTAIEEILVNGVEQPFEVLTSLRSWLTSAKCGAEEIKALEDQKREDQ